MTKPLAPMMVYFCVLLCLHDGERVGFFSLQFFPQCMCSMLVVVCKESLSFQVLVVLAVQMPALVRGTTTSIE